MKTRLVLQNHLSELLVEMCSAEEYNANIEHRVCFMKHLIELSTDLDAQINDAFLRKVERDVQATIQSKAYITMHTNLTSAVHEVMRYLAARGYDFNTDQLPEFSEHFIFFGVAHKQTKRGSYEIREAKTGKVLRKWLHVQIYRMESGTYELNCYIN